MKASELDTKAPITWCPGCTNFGILTAAKNAIVNLVNKGVVKKENVVVVTGIGCHAKIYDYLNLNGYYSIHGRVLPAAIGIKLGNPELTVIGFGGDGDTYAEGISHFVHACRYNADVKLIVHNNQVFALTTGQATPTTETGFKGKSTPLGVFEKPLNPIALALSSGATFVARGFALDIKHLTTLIERAIMHKGFAFVDVLQPCLSYHNTIPYLKERVYKLEEVKHDVKSFDEAMKKALEWDYTLRSDAKIPIGVFYEAKRKTYEESWPQLKVWWKKRRRISINKILNEVKV